MTVQVFCQLHFLFKICLWWLILSVSLLSWVLFDKHLDLSLWRLYEKIKKLLLFGSNLVTQHVYRTKWFLNTMTKQGQKMCLLIAPNRSSLACCATQLVPGTGFPLILMSVYAELINTCKMSLQISIRYDILQKEHNYNICHSSTNTDHNNIP